MLTTFHSRHFLDFSIPRSALDPVFLFHHRPVLSPLSAQGRSPLGLSFRSTPGAERPPCPIMQKSVVPQSGRIDTLCQWDTGLAAGIRGKSAVMISCTWPTFVPGLLFWNAPAFMARRGHAKAFMGLRSQPSTRKSYELQGIKACRDTVKNAPEQRNSPKNYLMWPGSEARGAGGTADYQFRVHGRLNRL